MRVVVTGGAGFIGSHLADAAVARGDEVHVIDDLTTGDAARVPPETVLHAASVADRDNVHRLVENLSPDVIHHLAAQVDVRASVADPAGDAEVNVIGTVNVLTAAHATGARVVLASTGGAIYGRDAPVPSAEDDQCAPESPYGVSKYCAESYAALFNRLHSTRHAVLRLANVYGPRQDPAGEGGVVSIFTGAVARGETPTIFGDGSQTRDYVYAGDVTSAFLAAGDSGRAGVWNIGTGRETSVGGLVELLGNAAGRDIDPAFAPARPGELHRSCLDVSHAERDLGFVARTRLGEGISNVYSWVRDGAPALGEL